MKKIFLVVAALGMLATSCTKDETTVAGGESLVSFTIDSPELATRYGEGAEADQLYYAFYEADENGAITNDSPLSEISALTEAKAVELNSGKATINVHLVDGRHYAAIFWAQAPEAPYTIDWEAQEMSYKDGVALTANNEDYDAFYAYYPVSTEKTHTVTLTRPFAQLNIATAQVDFDNAANAGLDAAQTKVTVNAYKTLDLVNGDVKNPTSFEFGWAEKADGVAKTNYPMLAMNYVLVYDRALVNVTMEVRKDASDTPITRTYSTVPVQRNYRTYIVGNLLTTPNDFEVDTKPGFEDDDEEYGVIDGQVYHEVDSTPEFIAALEDEDVDMVILTGDINLNDLTMRSTEDTTITIAADREFTIDLGGYKLSATSTQTGKNYNMLDVRGTLTVKNGTLEYKHEGENMNWNNFAEIFYVGFNGTLNLEGVTAKNLGGSDMAYVIDMVNATNITVNVKNSTLESTYIPVRVFNNSKTGVNNVSIKNSTLKGKFCFWVQYWLADGRDEATLKQTLKLDILNGTNTFECTGAAPILYGFNETIYYSVVNTAEELAAAFAEGGAYALNKNIETTSLTLANGKDVVLNLAGNTLSGVDEGTASYGLITNKGNLTINDIKGTGKIQLSATQNRGWNAYSSVISNQPGGVLVVNDGIIEHLGGTDMAYGIDNLTNGKGTSAVATVNGGVVKSPYRAIRQFLNGVEATNSLTVNGGVIEGANKSIWMQNANAKANPGKLVVEAAAQLKGDVFVSGSGATTFPVEVSVASAALVGESTVLTGNVPVQYEVVEENGTWVVKEKEGTVVTTADELKDALANGETTIVLADDVRGEAATTAPYGNKYAFKLDGGVIDGCGHELYMECYGDDYGIMTSGGTVKNVTITEGCRAIMIMYPQQDVIIDNAHIGGEGVLYPINTGEAGADNVNLVVTNSTLAGWTSYGLINSASFTNVKFEQGTYYNNIYGRVLKPYVNTTLTDCSFIAHMNLDLSALANGAKIVIKNCTVDGEAVTAEVFTIPTTDAQYDTELFTMDLPSWATSINDCVVFE